MKHVPNLCGRLVQNLTATTADVDIFDLLLQARERVLRVLEIRYEVVGGSARRPLDVRIFQDRLVKVDHNWLQESQGPSIVLARVFSG